MDTEKIAMGLAPREKLHGNSQRPTAADLRKLNDEFVKWRFPERAALERYRRQFTHVRVELAELKRTGSRQGLTRLKSDAVKLSGEIERLEMLLRH
jgi:hypothetical protein